MTLTFRPYEDSDLELLQACIMNWRKQNPDGTYCHAGDIPHRLYNGNRGVMPLSEITRIYYQGDTVAAILMCAPRYEGMFVYINPNLANEVDLFVPVVKAGFEIVSAYMQENGKSDRSIFAECFHHDDALAEILASSGFTQDNNAMNLTRRTLDNLPQIKLPEGFTIRAATMDDTEQLANVHNKSFMPSWTADIYRDEVMLKPGYSPEREFVVLAPDGTFAAFCVTWLDKLNKVGLFEPVGTHKDYQRKGLATTLMILAMHEVKKEGMVTAEVCYGTKNVAAEKLYTGLGFETRHHIYDWKRQAGDKA